MNFFELLSAEFLKLRRNYFIFALFVVVALYPFLYGFFVTEDFFSTEYARWSESRNIASIRLFFLSKQLSASRFVFSFFSLSLVVHSFTIDKPKKGINIIAFLPINKIQFFLIKLAFISLMLFGVFLLYSLFFFIVCKHFQETIVRFEIPITFFDSLLIGLHLWLTSLFYVFFLIAIFFIFSKLIYWAYAITVLLTPQLVPGGLFVLNDFLKSTSFFIFSLEYWFFVGVSIFAFVFFFSKKYIHFIAKK